MFRALNPLSFLIVLFVCFSLIIQLWGYTSLKKQRGIYKRLYRARPKIQLLNQKISISQQQTLDSPLFSPEGTLTQLEKAFGPSKASFALQEITPATSASFNKYTLKTTQPISTDYTGLRQLLLMFEGPPCHLNQRPKPISFVLNTGGNNHTDCEISFEFLYKEVK